MRRAVFLDRDGVINRLISRDGGRFSPRTVMDFELLPGAPAATIRLAEFGFLTIVVTNQPDISRGLMSAAELDKMHVVMRQSCNIDDIYVCPHQDSDKCPCRKPAIGLIRDACAHHNISPKLSWIVGDRNSDIQAGISSGLRTVFVRDGQDQFLPNQAEFSVEDLSEAAEIICRLQ